MRIRQLCTIVTPLLLLAACGGGAPEPEAPATPDAAEPAEKGGTATDDAKARAEAEPEEEAPRKVTLGEVKAENLDSNVSRMAIDPAMADFEACYESALSEASDAAGTVIITLLVGGDGELKSSAASYNGPASGTINKCMMEAARKLRMPTPDGAPTGTLVFHLELNPKPE